MILPMCKRISGFLHRYSIGWIFLLASTVFLLFMFLVLPAQSAKAGSEHGDSGSPDLSFYYTAEDLYRMAEDYGEAGRLSYVKSRFSFDLFWPLVYSLFLITGISWLGRKAFDPGSLMLRSNLAPLAGALFDYLENLSASVVMLRYPVQTEVLAGMAAIFTMAKWVFVSLSFILLLTVTAVAIWKWFKSIINRHRVV